MVTLPATVKRHPVLATVLAWLIVMTPVGMTAEAAFHLEYVDEPTKGLSFMPEGMIGLRTQPPPVYEPQRASGVAQGPSVRIVEPVSKWDCIAQKESGNRWDYNGSSGYDGGLQFSPSTWRAAGGERYAPYAHQASKEEQIAVAESWLAKTDWSQWPSTSRMCGYR